MSPISPKKLQHEMLQVFSSKKQQGLFFFFFFWLALILKAYFIQLTAKMTVFWFVLPLRR